MLFRSPIEGGDVIENPTFVQAKNAADMKAQQQQMGGNGMMGMPTVEDENPFDLYGDEMVESVTYNPDEDSDTNDAEKAEFENTFLKAFDNFLKQEENDTI